MDGQNGLQRGVILKPTHEVHHLHAIKKFSAFLLWNDWPSRALYPDDGAITIDCNNQSIAQNSSFTKQIDMPAVQNIETPVGKDNTFPGRLQLLDLGCDLVEGPNHLIMIASRFLLFPPAGPYG
jgi:hypothetical protein